MSKKKKFLIKYKNSRELLNQKILKKVNGLNLKTFSNGLPNKEYKLQA